MKITDKRSSQQEDQIKKPKAKKKLSWHKILLIKNLGMDRYRGRMLPKFHGYVLAGPQKDLLWSAPVPLNLIYRFLILLNIWLHKPFKSFDVHYRVHQLDMELSILRDNKKELRSRSIPVLTHIKNMQENFERKRLVEQVITDLEKYL